LTVLFAGCLATGLRDKILDWGATMIVIRPVESTDARHWAAARIALWPDEDAQELAQEAEQFFVESLPGLEAVLIAEDRDRPDEGIAGFVELSRRVYAEGCTSSPVAFLEGWYVRPEYRRQGIGRALVRAAEAWARQKGCREFASDTLADNTLSAAAHQALGFEEASLLRCFRKDV
jgi:aminoglycoside 6'-N-acetyltransferase I